MAAEIKKRMYTEKVGPTRQIINAAKAKTDLDSLFPLMGKNDPVGDIIYKFLQKKKMSVEVMSQLAGFARDTGYKIINGQRRAEKDVLLRLAFVLEMTPEETQHLLKSGRRATLSSAEKRDVVIIYGLSNHMTLGEMDDLLLEHGMKPLVPAGKAK